MSSTNTYAYLYRWTQLSTGMWYIGSRTRKGCHPGDGYICSSKTVRPMILEHKHDWQREILCIGEPFYIRALEVQFLCLLNAKYDSNSYNRSHGHIDFFTHVVSPDRRRKMSETHKRIGRTPEHDAKLIASRKGKSNTPAHNEKISLSKRGVKFSDEHRKKLSEAKKGKAWSADRRAAMKQPSSVELSVDVV